jgi:hypothetical protein
MAIKTKTAKTAQTTDTDVGPNAGPPESATITRDKRRRARALAVAKLGQSGHPMAAGAAALAKKVDALEDELDRERTMLMAVLRSAGS